MIQAEVIGLDGWLHTLKRSERRTPLALKVAMQKAATEVYEKATSSAYALGSVAAKSAADLSLGADYVKFGGAPYDMGAEYGSLAHPQFKPWLGNGDDAGYFLWPAVREYQRGQWERDALDTLDREIIEPLGR